MKTIVGITLALTCWLWLIADATHASVNWLFEPLTHALG